LDLESWAEGRITKEEQAEYILDDAPFIIVPDYPPR
jgi:hypothetical protein